MFFVEMCRMEASATSVHIYPPSDTSTDNFPARTAPDEYVFSFEKSSMQDPLLPASGAPYPTLVTYNAVKSFLNDVWTLDTSSFFFFFSQYIDFSLN